MNSNKNPVVMKMSTAKIEQLNVSMRETSDKRLYERYLAVRLRFEGHSFEEIGHLLNRTRQTISLYWQAYQEHGLAGLEMDHSPGQPTTWRHAGTKDTSRCWL
jgi:hypothetical protein